MKRVTCAILRSRSLLIFVLIAGLFVINSRQAERLGKSRWLERFSPEQLDWLVKNAPPVLPGGMQARDWSRVERLPLGLKGVTAAVTAESSGADLVFPHFVDGSYAAADIKVECSIILIGTTNRNATADVLFFDDNGAPLPLKIGGVTASKFSYSVASGQTLRIKTDGGDLKTGWVKVHASQPVGGSLTYALSTMSGRLDSEVGVDESTPLTEVAIFAEYNAASNTGVAFTNLDQAAPNRVDLFVNDLAGQQLYNSSITLQPGSKKSQFVTELFPGILSKAPFQGVMVLKSEKPIGVLTLRQRGRHVTSLPSVRKYDADETPFDLFFYRVGSGVASGLQIQTSFIVINNSDVVTNAVLDLVKEDGTPLVTKIGSTTGSTFNVTIQPRGAACLATQDTGGLQVGWARLRPDHRLNGAATFTLYQGTSSPQFMAEVGVDTTIPLDTWVQVFADSIGDRNTGIAFSNTSDTDTISVYPTLYNKQHSYVASVSTPLNLAPRQHVAKFLTELFPTVKGIDEFEGSIEFYVGQTMIAGTLRTAGSLLTSLPTLMRLHGFKPTTEVELFGDLAASKPAACLKIQQFDEDMSLETVEVSMPEVKFNGSILATSIGAPVLFADSGATGSDVTLFGKLDSVDTDGTARLTAYRVSPGDQGAFVRMANITLSGSPTSGNFKATLAFFGTQAATYIDSDFFLEIFLPDGLIQVPQAGEKIHTITTLRSVSSNRRLVRSLVETNRQEFQIPTRPAGTPSLERIRPMRGRAPGPMVLKGANLGSDIEQLRVVFTGIDGPIEVKPAQLNNNIVALTVPANVKTGPVTIKRGSESSNPYQFVAAFAPQDEFALESVVNNTAVNMSGSIGQQEGELAFYIWQMLINKGSLKLDGLAVQQVVGSGKWTHPCSYCTPSPYKETVYELRVGEIGTDYVKLMLYDPKVQWTDLWFKLSNVSGGGVLIETVPNGREIAPVASIETFKIEWKTTTPLLKLPAGAGTPINAAITKISYPSGPGAGSDFNTYSDYSWVLQ